MPKNPQNQTRKGRTPTRNKPAKPTKPATPPIPISHAKALVDFTRETIEVELGRAMAHAFDRIDSLEKRAASTTRRNRELAARLQVAEKAALQATAIAKDNHERLCKLVHQLHQQGGAFDHAVQQARAQAERIAALEVTLRDTENAALAARNNATRANDRLDRLGETIKADVEANRKVLQETKAAAEKVGNDLGATIGVLNVRDKEIRDKLAALNTRVAAEVVNLTERTASKGALATMQAQIEELSKAVATVVAWIPNAHKDAPQPQEKRFSADHLPALIQRESAGGNWPIHMDLFAAARLEVAKARAKFPSNSHLVLALAEEAGEVVKAALDLHQGKSKPEDLLKELYQVIGLCLRVATEGDPTIGVPVLIHDQPSKDPRSC